jgi:uncharacterized membrane protein YgcG
MISIFRIKPFILTSLLLAFIALPGFAFAESPVDISQPPLIYGFEIPSFDAEIKVHEDASLTVTEHITTIFGSDAFKHGLLRVIPVTYKDRYGNAVRMHVDVISVLLDGQAVTFEERKANARDLEIKIGDADIIVTGEHVYTIEYEVERAMLYLEDIDELYWNVTGTDWGGVQIAEVTALVVLPGGAEIVKQACYTGEDASMEQNCGFATEESNSAFAAEDYLTIAVGFTKGVVYEPSQGEYFGFFVQDNWYIVLPIFWAIFVIGLWFVHGRDPKMRTIVVEFKPPEGLWAAYAGLLTRQRVTSHDISAMFLQLAVKGYMRIHVKEEKKKKDISFEKRKEGDDLDPAHKALFQLIFPGEKTLRTLKDFKKTSAAKVSSEVKLRLRKFLADEKIFTKHSRLMAGAFVIVGIFMIFIVTAVGSLLGAVMGVMTFAAVLITIVFGMLMPKRTRKGTETVRRLLGFKLYMHTAERYRSEWQEKKNIFAEYLPYAVAFRQVKQWAKAFEGVDIEKPDWYQGNWTALSMMQVGNQLSSVTHAIAVAQTPASGSGGSSGGGFSGGGFGGGGGASW